MKPKTLRAQLTLVYTLALVGGLLLFAAISLIVLDRSALATLDQRLLTEGRAISSIVDTQNGLPVIEAGDRQQFARIVGVKLSGAVYDTAGRQLLTSTNPVPSQVRAFIAKPPGRSLTTLGPADAQLRVATVPIVSGGHTVATAVLWRSLDEIEELRERSELVFAFAIPIIVAFAILFGTIVAGRGLVPLRRLADLASDIEAHDLSRRLAVHSERDELGALCGTFDRMLDRLEAAFSRERRFTSDASHELRGPLSVIRAETELTLRRKRSVEEYERTLRTILAEAEALETLTSDLLAAARAQDTASPARVLDFGAVVANVCERLGVLGQARNVGIDAITESGLSLHGDISQLTRLVFAIVHNAVKYSPAGARVHVYAERFGKTVRLRVEDAGSGFSSAALGHAFERFWRDEEARFAEGTGLGLSIAQNIASAYGGEITLANREHGGAIVSVTLPLLRAGERDVKVQQEREQHAHPRAPEKRSAQDV